MLGLISVKFIHLAIACLQHELCECTDKTCFHRPAWSLIVSLVLV